MCKPPKIPTNEELLKIKIIKATNKKIGAKSVLFIKIFRMTAQSHRSALKYYQHTLYHQNKRDPIWVALEKEMRANTKKPYNEKVGKWLEFLKSLTYHYYITELRKYNRLLKGTGPPWYIEFSVYQITILLALKEAMHRDSMEHRTHRTARHIKDLGISLIFPETMLLEAVENCTEDPGIFFWILYTLYYKVSPTKLLPRYDENAMIMMSALVFVDLEACKQEILRLTTKKPPPPPKPPKKPKKITIPDIKYGAYLQKMHIPCYSNYPKKIPKPKSLLPLQNKIKLRTQESYTKLAASESFLEIRKEKNRQERLKERKCNYKFWQAPRSLRTKDKAMAAYIKKLKMFKRKPNASHMEIKAPFDNIQFYVKGISYCRNKPIYNLECIVNIPTGYIPINGGEVLQPTGTVLNILGYYRYPMDTSEPCDSSCDCLEKWDSKVKEHLSYSKCECHHSYDFNYEGKSRKKYFNPPKDNAPFWIDEAQVYQFDDWQDFVRDEFDAAMDSSAGTFSSSTVTISPTQLKEKELLSAFLADMSHSPLMIPHLPKANLLMNLQEFVRKHVKGNQKKSVHKDLLLKSKRKWIELDHINFAERTYLIPFTEKQLDKIKFCHRPQIQELSEILLKDFELRTRKSWLEYSRFLWTTMMSDVYPSKRFLDVFFTYMPARLVDTYVVNPFSPSRTPRNVGKTCRIDK